MRLYPCFTSITQHCSRIYMGNYTVPVHCQLLIPAKFLLPCICIHVPTIVESSGY